MDTASGRGMTVGAVNYIKYPTQESPEAAMGV